MFSDFVGFTEISSRLAGRGVGEFARTRCSRHSTRLRGARAWRRSRPSATRTWRRPGSPGRGRSRRRGGGPGARDAAAVRDAGDPWQVRIGLHRGPVVAGVIGTSKFVYDLWGDAVNVASRLETTAPPGRIQVSEAVATALGDAFELEPRGAIELKGKGSTEAFFLLGRRA